MKRYKYNIILSIFLFLIVSNDLISQEYLSKLKPGATELTENRTACSKTFLNPDGTRTAIISTTPIHFLDESGTWRQIEGDSSNEISYKYYTGVYRDIYPDPPDLYYFFVPDLLGIDDTAGEQIYHISRIYIKWSTSSIPDSSTIDDAYFEMELSPSNSNNNVTIAWDSIGSYTEDDDAKVVYDSIGVGEAYNQIQFHEETVVTFMDDKFNEDIENKLGEDYIAVGLRNVNEASYDSCIQVIDDPAYEGHNLIVTYTPPAAPVLCVEPSSLTVPSWGSAAEIIQVSNCGTDSSIIDYNVNTNDNWIHVSALSGTTPGYFTISVDPNQTADTLAGVVSVSANGLETKEIHITQNGIPDVLFLQNKLFRGQETIVAWEDIIAGNHVTNEEPYGDVIITSTANVSFRTGSSIHLEPGFRVNEHAYFHGYIEPFEPINNTNVTTQSLSNANDSNEMKNILFQEQNTDSFIESNVSIYPNPNAGIFNISFLQHNDVPITIEVRNIVGALVFNKEINGVNSCQVDISTFPSGIYFVNIKIGNKQHFKKIIKQR